MLPLVDSMFWMQKQCVLLEFMLFSKTGTFTNESLTVLFAVAGLNVHVLKQTFSDTAEPSDLLLGTAISHNWIGELLNYH